MSKATITEVTLAAAVKIISWISKWVCKRAKAGTSVVWEKLVCQHERRPYTVLTYRY